MLRTASMLSRGPPAGAVYEGRISIPIQQTVRIAVHGQGAATIELIGLLRHRGDFRFCMLDEGRVGLRFSERTQRYLERAGVSVTAVRYDAATDSASLAAGVAILPGLLLNLHRVN
jgi:hypothetical protein